MPKSALASRRRRGRACIRVVDGTAKFVPVETGGDVQGQVEVTKGLQGGETLISQPDKAGIQEGETRSKWRENRHA